MKSEKINPKRYPLYCPSCERFQKRKNAVRIGKRSYSCPACGDALIPNSYNPFIDDDEELESDENTVEDTDELREEL